MCAALRQDVPKSFAVELVNAKTYRSHVCLVRLRRFGIVTRLTELPSSVHLKWGALYDTDDDLENL